MYKLLILKGLGCPVFWDSYRTLEFFLNKMGHPYDENVYVIDFKDNIDVFKNG